MIDIGVAKPEGAGAGDDQHRNGVDKGIGHARLRPDPCPYDEGDNRDADHDLDKISGDDVRQFLDRRTAPLGLGDHVDDLRQKCLGPDLFRLHDQRARPVHGCADNAVTRLLHTGIGSPVIMDSSTLLDPSVTVPSTGTFSPGRTRRRSPGLI